MSKELEAFGRLVGYDKESRGVYSYTLGYSNGKTRTLEDVIKDIDIVTNALQPISNDEAKEAIESILTYDMGKELGTEILKGEYDSELYKDYQTITSYISQLESETKDREETILKMVDVVCKNDSLYGNLIRLEFMKIFKSNVEKEEIFKRSKK